jgi:hypothetical protein
MNCRMLRSHESRIEKNVQRKSWPTWSEITVTWNNWRKWQTSVLIADPWTEILTRDLLENDAGVLATWPWLSIKKNGQPQLTTWETVFFERLGVAELLPYLDPHTPSSFPPHSVSPKSHLNTILLPRPTSSGRSLPLRPHLTSPMLVTPWFEQS